jgi:ABC-type nitrate/sulfonate/bicarbonate transport system substrate-binding protein
MNSPAPNLSVPKPVASRHRSVRLGYLALADAAPFAVAAERGLFEPHGLRVELRREIGWATIRDKIIYGELDAAQAPAAMLWSAQLGLGCPPSEVLTALVLNLHGNAITLSRALREAGVRDGATLRQHIRARRMHPPLTLAVVFPFSSHHLMLRDWLRTAEIDPDRDVRVVVVPPAQVFRNLTAGTIDGFCAGEPWNSLAVSSGIGWCPTWSAAHAPGHVEKVLLVTRRFAETRPDEHAALIAALAEACAWCDEPQNRESLIHLLAQTPWVNLPVPTLAPSLQGRFDAGFGRIADVPDFLVFHRDGANFPAVEKAAALQHALGAAGLISDQQAADPKLPAQLFREDLHKAAIHAPQTAV